MPTWLKILVIVFGSLFVVLVLIGFLAYRWVSANKDEIQSGMQKMSQEAREFAAGKDSEACIAETIVRHSKCGDLGVVCQSRANIFAIECLRVAETPPDFCASVPRPGELREVMRWSPAECTRRGMSGNTACARAIAMMPQFCEQKRLER